MGDLTNIQKLLLFGLKMFNMTADNMTAIMMNLDEEEDDQLLMIDYLMKHSKATELDIMSKMDDIIAQRRTINKLRKKISEDFPD
jgi:hypothetical protein